MKNEEIKFILLEDDIAYDCDARRATKILKKKSLKKQSESGTNETNIKRNIENKKFRAVKGHKFLAVGNEIYELNQNSWAVEEIGKGVLMSNESNLLCWTTKKYAELCAPDWAKGRDVRARILQSTNIWDAYDEIKGVNKTV